MPIPTEELKAKADNLFSAIVEELQNRGHKIDFGSGVRKIDKIDDIFAYFSVSIHGNYGLIHAEVVVEYDLGRRYSVKEGKGFDVAKIARKIEERLAEKKQQEKELTRSIEARKKATDAANKISAKYGVDIRNSENNALYVYLRSFKEAEAVAAFIEEFRSKKQ